MILVTKTSVCMVITYRTHLNLPRIHPNQVADKFCQNVYYLVGTLINMEVACKHKNQVPHLLFFNFMYSVLRNNIEN